MSSEYSLTKIANNCISVSLSVPGLKARVGKQIDKNNRICLNIKLSVLSSSTDSKGISPKNKHFHNLEMSECPLT